MGVDIHGAIECRPGWGGHLDWEHAMPLWLAYEERNYDAFGCLFGVTNYAGFRPVARDRGVPDNASALTKQTFSSHEFTHPTWVSWPELRHLKLEELADFPDQRIHQYVRDETTGEWVFDTKAVWSKDLADLTGAPPSAEPSVRWPEGTELVAGDRLFRSVRIRRKDAVDPDGDWRTVWAVMAALADQHGADNLRLVVWFDGQDTVA